MDINNILSKIKTYKKSSEQERQNVLDKVNVLKPDINNLLEVAIAAHKAGIAVGSFFLADTEGIIEFVKNDKEITGIQLFLHQYNDDSLFTNGISIYNLNRKYKASTGYLEKFIEKFPEFERAFYDYIEKVTGGKH